jgi:hypothetical protein
MIKDNNNNDVTVESNNRKPTKEKPIKIGIPNNFLYLDKDRKQIIKKIRKKLTSKGANLICPSRLKIEKPISNNRYFCYHQHLLSFPPTIVILHIFKKKI